MMNSPARDRRRVTHSAPSQFRCSRNTSDGTGASDEYPPMPIPPERPQFEGLKSMQKYAENMAWLLSAAGTCYITDFINVCKTSADILSYFFYVGFFMGGVSVGIGLYLVCYLAYFKKIDSEQWEVIHPNAIPIATGTFIISTLCWMVAFYPVYGLTTVPILFVMFMGVVTLIGLLPSWM